MLKRAGAVGTDVEVPLPASLARFGAATRARLFGAPAGPLVVALGGISADRFVADEPDGGRGWWSGLVGAGRAIDPARHRILGLDFAADPAGRVAPTTADQADILCAALDAVDESRARAVVGASYGGMVALALGQHRPERAERLVVISAPAEPDATAGAMRELQRRIVALGLATGREAEALSIARGLAMLTYRTPEELSQRFSGGLAGEDTLGTCEAGAYLRARGDAYRDTMSPQRFLSLSASIDRHFVDPARIPLPVLAVGALSDRLVPPAQMRALGAALPDSRLHLFDSLYGHDMFLKETERLGALVSPFLEAE